MMWQVWVSVGVATAILAVYRMRKRINPDFGLPVVGSPNDQNMANAVLEGYRKYPDSAFVIPCDPPRVILPMNLYQEVIHAPMSELSFHAEVYDAFVGRYSHVGESRGEVVKAVQHDLTRSLPGVLLPIQEEVRVGMKQLFGQSNKWKAFNANQLALRMVALMSGRVFVGLPLSRDEEWLRASITFTTNVAKCRIAALQWNPWVRPFVLRFLPEVRHVRQELQRATEWMRPLVNEILQNEHAVEDKLAKPGTRGAFISRMMNYLPDHMKTAEEMGIDQMLLSFASIHTTSSTTTFALFDLVSRPEYIKPLRDELEHVIAQEGVETNEDGHTFLSKSSLGKLKKLDSFIKESQRLNPLNMGGSPRRLQKDQTFSNGLKLPAGAPISFPLWGVYNSPTVQTFSPEYNEKAGNAKPNEFDGFRFARLREQPELEMRHQAVTTGPDAFNFGHGPHACPGRFFAIYMIKCIFIELLLNYDFQLKGSDGNGSESRPPNVVKQMMNLPNFAAEVEVRKRG